MQPALAHKQADFVQEEARNRTSLAIDAAAGLECLQQTLAIAEAAGQYVARQRNFGSASC